MLSQAFRERLLASILRLRDAGEPFTYWWRDDDAERATDALSRLVELGALTATPIVLAVIPAGADNSLVDSIRAAPHLHTWQHGFAHVNHAPAGVKKMELGVHRPVDRVLGELEGGRLRLQTLLGARFDNVLVPPWNRIDAQVVAGLVDVGLDRLSTFGSVGTARDSARPVRCANTHVDVIDWRGTRGFAGEGAVLSQLLRHIEARIDGRAPIAEATGLLTHHLVHDEPCWAFLEDLTQWLGEQPSALALPPERLFDGV